MSDLNKTFKIVGNSIDSMLNPASQQGQLCLMSSSVLERKKKTMNNA